MAISLEAGRLCEKLLEQGPACNWLVNGDLVFHHVFGNALPLFGKSGGELRGLSLTDVIPPDARETWTGRVRRVFEGQTLLFREQTPAGAISVNMFPVRNGGPGVDYAGGCAVDVTAWSGAERELRHTALDVLKAQEAERTRLARFLHDDVGQCLSATGLQLDLLRMDLEPAVPAITARTTEVQQMLEGVMERVREYSYELNPAMVERAGLCSALDRLAGRMRRTFPGTLRLMTDSSLRLPAPVAAAFYKIAEQAVDNAIRHSGCAKIELLLKSTRQGPALEIRDNGCGFDPNGSDRPQGLGLMIMEHCAVEANLSFEIRGNRPRGTVVKAGYQS